VKDGGWEQRERNEPGSELADKTFNAWYYTQRRQGSVLRRYLRDVTHTWSGSLIGKVLGLASFSAPMKVHVLRN